MCAALLLSASAGCTGDGGDGDGRAAAGPLARLAPAGGVSLRRPDGAGVSSVVGTFGGFRLCSTTGQRLVIDDVELEQRPRARSVEVLARTVTPSSGPAGKDVIRSILYSSLGPPDDLEHDQVLAGRIQDARGFVVDLPCSQQTPQRFDELLVVPTAGPGGATLSSMTVRYHAAGESYRLVTRWQMVLCGSRTQDPSVC